MNLDRTTSTHVGIGAKRRWKRHCPDWAFFPTFSPLRKERGLAGFVPALAFLSWSLALLLASGIAWMLGAAGLASGLLWFSGGTLLLGLVSLAATFLVSFLRCTRHC